MRVQDPLNGNIKEQKQKNHPISTFMKRHEWFTGNFIENQLFFIDISGRNGILINQELLFTLLRLTLRDKVAIID